MNKMTCWIKRKSSYLKDWVYNKKPRNKYLRVVYYFLTGLVYSMFTSFLFFIGFAFLLVASKQMLTYLGYLVNFNDFSRITFLLLMFVFLSLIASLMGYFMFKDD